MRPSPRVTTAVCAVTLLIPGTATAEVAGSAGSKIVIHAQFKSASATERTITYTSSKGTYTAKWIGVRRYRLSGRITGRRFSGTIRTRQAASGGRYLAKGSGRLGGRRVSIRGGGPNSLQTAKLVLR